MYKPFPNFESPDEDTIIWRYMDISKYLSLIIDKDLFFPRCDFLEDEFEGVSPENQIAYEENLINIHPEDTLWFRKSRRESENMWRRRTAISCWHMNDFESAAMWKIYLQTGEGIAVQSTFRRLKESFNSHQEDEIYIGKVKYKNYDESLFGNLLYANFIHKRQYFPFENELRAIIIKGVSETESIRDDKGNFDMNKVPGLMHGVNVKVDLSTLIEKVVVAPNTPDWILNVITKVTEKYELAYQIERSKMDNTCTKQLPVMPNSYAKFLE